MLENTIFSGQTISFQFCRYYVWLLSANTFVMCQKQSSTEVQINVTSRNKFLAQAQSIIPIDKLKSKINRTQESM